MPQKNSPAIAAQVASIVLDVEGRPAHGERGVGPEAVPGEHDLLPETTFERPPSGPPS
jgi:hypothetical protein